MWHDKKTGMWYDKKTGMWHDKNTVKTCHSTVFIQLFHSQHKQDILDSTWWNSSSRYKLELSQNDFYSFDQESVLSLKSFAPQNKSWLPNLFISNLFIVDKFYSNLQLD